MVLIPGASTPKGQLHGFSYLTYMKAVGDMNYSVDCVPCPVNVFLSCFVFDFVYLVKNRGFIDLVVIV